MRASYFCLKKFVLVVLVVLFIIFTHALPTHAYWRDVRHVVLNSAYTLEEEEFKFGIFTPLQYGIYNWLTIEAHPILFLILTPNLTLRFRAYNGPVAISFHIGYMQTFLRSSQGKFPGAVHASTLITIPIGNSFALTFGPGYLLDIFPTQQNVFGQVGCNVLITNSDLLIFQGKFTYNITQRDFLIPVGTMLYSHAWESFHLGIGIVVGNIKFRIGKQEYKDIPAYPIVDLWWQF